MSYFNRPAHEISQLTGRMEQLASIRTAALDDGRSRGLRIADVDNGTGLRFTVLADRGMDIGQASFHGIPLAYLTSAGFAHPAYYEPEDLRWLRSFGGGLLTGCGLSNVGIPQPYDAPNPEGPHGLHGRLSNTPSEQVAVRQEWVDGRYELSIIGRVRQAAFFGENLELVRTISTALGDNRIIVRDRITNLAHRPAPLMILYHINLGFPLLDDTATLHAPAHDVAARDEHARTGLDRWPTMQPPTPGYREMCYYHDLPAGDDGMAAMVLRNRGLDLELEVSFRKAEMPMFTQWKMMGQGEYVLGLEPANCHPDGQAAERKAGTLEELAAGETIETLVIIAPRRT